MSPQIMQGVPTRVTNPLKTLHQISQMRTLFKQKQHQCNHFFGHRVLQEKDEGKGWVYILLYLSDVELSTG